MKNKLTIMFVLAIVLAIALTDGERQKLELEKAQLETELSDAGYGLDNQIDLNVNNLFIYINSGFNYEIK